MTFMCHFPKILHTYVTWVKIMLQHDVTFVTFSNVTT